MNVQQVTDERLELFYQVVEEKQKMNERIKELAKKAGYTPIPGFDFASSLEEVFIAKFAELIIREYSYDVMNLTCMPDHVEMAARHWGVEL